MATRRRWFQFSLKTLLCTVLFVAAVCATTRTLLDGREFFEVTNNPLDVAIDGDGFFQVIDPMTKAVLYTRVGNFAVDSTGRLVIDSATVARPVQPQLSLPGNPADFVISSDGTMWMPHLGRFKSVGSLRLAIFANPNWLRKVSDGFYQETSLSGAPIFGQPDDEGFGSIRQHALERRGLDMKSLSEFASVQFVRLRKWWRGMDIPSKEQ